MKLLKLIVLAFSNIQNALADKKVVGKEILDAFRAISTAEGLGQHKVMYLSPAAAKQIRQALTLVKKSVKPGEYTVDDLQNIADMASKQYGLDDLVFFDLTKK